MILRSNKLQEETKLEQKGDNFILTKIVNIEPILAANYDAKRDQQNGWAKDRSYRRFGRVPLEIIMMWKQEFPEIMSGDRKAEHNALKKLFSRPENEGYMTVRKKMGMTL